MLPNIIVPNYEITLPSNEKKVKIRAYTVQEEKIILTAMETKETSHMVQALKQTTQNCLDVDGQKIDIDELPDIDLQYIFLQVRIHSVGEMASVGMKPEICGNRNPEECKVIRLDVNLNEVTIEKDESHSNKIPLMNGFGVVMKYPTIKALSEIKSAEGSDMIYQLVAGLVECVYTETEVFNDFTHTEIYDWISKLPRTEFAKISKFFSSQPKLVKEVSYRCEVCGKEDTVRFEGIQSFLF